MTDIATYLRSRLVERPKKTKRFSRSIGGDILMLLLLLLCAAVMVLPLVYTAVNAFKPVNELYLYPPRFFAQHPTTENFGVMFNLISSLRVPLERYLFNSLLVSGVGTVGYVLVSALAAYPLAKHPFRFKALLVNIVVWAMLFRTEVTSIPQFVLISKLNMVNNYLALILPAMAGSMGVFLMRQFMVAGIPDSLLEAARMDGAGEMRIFARIVMPMVKPAWLTLTIFCFQDLWKLTGVQYIYKETMKPMPVVLDQIASMGLSRAGAASAVALVMILPPIIMFLFCQNSVMETMSTSGIK